MTRLARTPRLVAALLAAGALDGGAALAQDIPLDLDPGEDTPDVLPEPEEGEEEAPPPAAGGEAAGGEAAGEGEAGPEGFYYSDGSEQLGNVDDAESPLARRGPVPELHIVRGGDTLWDICAFYFNNAWDWPRVWSYNPTITNPHWIYPGDLVRLYPPGEGPVVEPDPADPEPVARAAPVPQRRTGFSLRQLAFVESEEMKRSFTVAGAEEERTMLSANDIVYLDYPEGKPPQVGRRYAVYSEVKKVQHPKSGKVVGSYVRIVGELEVLSVKKGKKARAVVRESMDVMERGQRVGPVQRTYRDITPTRNGRDAQGTIVAQIGADFLIGATEIVFVDLGKQSGVKVGNRMFIVRRGDAEPRHLVRSEVGRNDDRFPAYAIGEILVIDVGDEISAGLVTMSLQESEVGDHVLMRKSD